MLRSSEIQSSQDCSQKSESVIYRGGLISLNTNESDLSKIGELRKCDRLGETHLGLKTIKQISKG